MVYQLGDAVVVSYKKLLEFAQTGLSYKKCKQLCARNGSHVRTVGVMGRSTALILYPWNIESRHQADSVSREESFQKMAFSTLNIVHYNSNGVARFNSSSLTDPEPATLRGA